MSSAWSIQCTIKYTQSSSRALRKEMVLVSIVGICGNALGNTFCGSPCYRILIKCYNTCINLLKFQQVIIKVKLSEMPYSVKLFYSPL
jgi:hypothetical protein